MDGHDMAPDDDLGAADLLHRLYLLLHATAASPSDGAVLQLALIQALAATGADIAVLGKVKDRDVIDVAMLFDTDGYVHEMGVLDVGSRYPLTDVIIRESPIWLPSLPEIRRAYPDGGPLWGSAFAGVPLMVRGTVVGAIGLIYDTAGHRFTAAEREFLRAVADLCATVLGHPYVQAWPPSEVSPAVDT